MPLIEAAPTLNISKATQGVFVAGDLEGLSSIHQAGQSAALWQRTPLQGFQRWINGLPADKLPKTRVLLQPSDVPEVVSIACDTSGMPDGPERVLLIDDVSALALEFAEIMKTSVLRLRLDVVLSNMCSQFHRDATVARLICTYRGTGTQYGVSEDGLEPSQILTVPTGSPIILRGSDWADSHAPLLLHRSPPIAGTGETRLLLVIDPIYDLDDQPDRDLLH